MGLFVYGTTEDSIITFNKNCNINLKIKGAHSMNHIDMDLLKDFIGDHFNNGLVSYDELHNFCTEFLLCDQTEKHKEIKQFLEE